MESVKWNAKGQYFETCNCDYLCPCIVTNLAAQPTKGFCDVALAFHVEQGRYGSETLDGLNFVVVAHAPEAMGKGNWSVGLITDARATPAQQQALVQIGSGQGGGPMAALAPVVGSMVGVESRPIRFEINGLRRSVSVPGLLEQSVEGFVGSVPNEPIFMENTVHPVTARLALAKSTGSHFHVFGRNWDDTSGQNNGHFAPFDWKSS
jgi:hypothetical protein